MVGGGGSQSGIAAVGGLGASPGKHSHLRGMLRHARRRGALCRGGGRVRLPRGLRMLLHPARLPLVESRPLFPTDT